jgi:glycerophosphoryl diester phosphodiesterase
MLGFAILAAVVGLAWWAGPGWRPRPLPGTDRPRPWRLGHRGARGPEGENTRPALRLALATVDGVETDVQRTSDGELVLYHDLADGSLRIRDAEAALLRDRIPGLATLDELFDEARAHPGTILNLELKTTGRPFRRGRLERDVVRAVRASGLADRVLISSFDPLALARVRLLAPSLRTGLLTAADAPRGLRGGAPARWLHVDALHPEDRQVDEALLRRCRARGLPVHVWTVNDPQRMGQLARAGVGALIGDRPEDLARYGTGRETPP